MGSLEALTKSSTPLGCEEESWPGIEGYKVLPVYLKLEKVAPHLYRLGIDPMPLEEEEEEKLEEEHSDKDEAMHA